MSYFSKLLYFSEVRRKFDRTAGSDRVNARSLATQKHHKHASDFDAWCDDTRPHMLSNAEWKELIAIPAIRESWGLDPDETIENFASQVYVVKFHFHSGSPGYVGDLYILQGDVLTGDAPFVLLRDKEGRLKFAEY